MEREHFFDILKNPLISGVIRTHVDETIAELERMLEKKHKSQILQKTRLRQALDGIGPM